MLPKRNGSVQRLRPSERKQLDLFRALPGDLAPPDAQDLMAYPFFSFAKSKRVAPIDFRAGTISIQVEAVPEHGMATIWDADVLIWAASQIVQPRDVGLKTSRLMAATPQRKTCDQLVLSGTALLEPSGTRSSCHRGEIPTYVLAFLFRLRCGRRPFVSSVHFASTALATNQPALALRKVMPRSQASQAIWPRSRPHQRTELQRERLHDG